MEIDTVWFQTRIAARKYGSQRQFAFALGMEPSALSLTLKGQRNLQLDEAEALAMALSVPLTEILTRAEVKLLKPKQREPFPNVSKNVKRLLAKTPSKNPVWDATRAIYQVRK